MYRNLLNARIEWISLLKLRNLQSSVTECNSSTNSYSNGNGLFQFIQKSFCSNGICNELSVCRLRDDQGEASYYIPIDGSQNISSEIG